MPDFHCGWKRGKGSRRIPWREGGIGKRIKRSWVHQTPHAVSDPNALRQPVSRIVFESDKRHVEEAAYLFDQAAAVVGLRYFIAGYWRHYYLGCRLEIVVAVEDVQCASRLSDKLRARRPAALEYFRPRNGDLYWHEVVLKGRNAPKSEWVFAVYTHYGADGRESAFVYRNRRRTIFGIQKFVTNDEWSIRSKRWEEMARRIITDPAFRKSLISDDPALPKLWRRH